MKIEKLSDTQIRCTLNRSDLAERELKLSELAYGSEKARDLFREMMQQASFEFGFEADDIPLMIEAIPVSSDCIVLMITKVEDPEELDTRFSKFAPSHEEDVLSGTMDEDRELDSLFSKIQEIRDAMELNTDEMNMLEEIVDEDPDAKKSVEETASQPSVRIFQFESIDQASEACRQAGSGLTIKSSFYKDENTHTYALVINDPSCDIDTQNRICNILCEYGTRVRAQYATENYYKEHLTVIIKKDAIKVLANL